MSEITLCSYNIHGAVGTDGRLEPARIAQVLKEVDADLVALQEVEHHDCEGEDLPYYLAAEGGYEAFLGPTLYRAERLYGNVLLSRLPVASVTRLDISVKGREPRGALDVMLAVGDRLVRLVITHLGLLPGERRDQVQTIVKHLETVSRADISVLTGDINEWFLWGRPVRWLNAHFEPAPTPATFPTSLPLLALDRIWISPKQCLVSVQTHRSALARKASDHLPLLTRIRVK